MRHGSTFFQKNEKEEIGNIFKAHFLAIKEMQFKSILRINSSYTSWNNYDKQKQQNDNKGLETFWECKLIQQLGKFLWTLAKSWK